MAMSIASKMALSIRDLFVMASAHLCGFSGSGIVGLG